MKIWEAKKNNNYYSLLTLLIGDENLMGYFNVLRLETEYVCDRYIWTIMKL